MTDFVSSLSEKNVIKVARKYFFPHNFFEDYPLSWLPPGLASAIVAKFDDSFCH